MWEVGNLVYYDKDNGVTTMGLQPCRCTCCLKGTDSMYGVVTESWIDEDDTVAIMVDFHEYTSIFRSNDRLCLREAHEL